MTPAREDHVIWVKSTLAGLVAAFVTVVSIVAVTTTSTISAGEGSGGIGAVSIGISGLLLFPAALAFALGFRWMFRRGRRAVAR